MRKWTEEEDRYLIENYCVNSSDNISQYLDRSKTSIIQRAAYLNIRKSGLPDDITVDDLIEKYKELQSIRKVEKIFGIHKSKVGYYLKKAGVINKPIKYTLDDNFFSQDTPESFYWAGFIAADGCVKLEKKKHKRLSIGLSDKDHSHLEKFKETINFNGPIHKTAINTGGYKSEITISSEKIFDDLARFNIVPRKSLIYTFPEWLIDHSLVNHFMRGYFDGDGSFYSSVNKKTGRKIEQLYFSLRGTKEFLTTYKNILEKNCGVKKSDKKPRLNSNIYTLEYGGTRIVSKIRDFLYSGSTNKTKLDRKYNIVFNQKFIDIPDNYSFKKIIGINIKTRERLEFNSIIEAEKYGFIGTGISACCNGKYNHHKGYVWSFIDQDIEKIDIDSIVVTDVIRWSNEEIKYLKHHYSTTDNKKISEYLGREIRHIMKKANKLGLKKDIKTTTSKSIVAINDDGETITYSSVTMARKNGFPKVSSALKTGKKYKGYIWKYAMGVTNV